MVAADMSDTLQVEGKKTRGVHLIHLATLLEPTKGRAEVSGVILSNTLLLSDREKNTNSRKHLTNTRKPPPDICPKQPFMRLRWLSQIDLAQSNAPEGCVCLSALMFSHKHLTDRSDMLTGLCTADAHPQAISVRLQFGFNLEEPRGKGPFVQS